MANLFSRFSANIEQSQTVVEKQDNKALGALRNSLQVVKDSSEKAKAPGRGDYFLWFFYQGSAV